MFIRFDTTHECDRWTDRRRMTAKAALDRVAITTTFLTQYLAMSGSNMLYKWCTE